MTHSALAGKTVLVTRGKEQAASFSAKLRAVGAVPVEIPLIAIRPAAPEEIASMVERLGEYRWLVFTSANAVRFFFPHVSLPRPLPEMAVVGRKTAAALAEHGLSPALVPDDYTAERLADLLMPRVKQGDRVLFVKGNLARPTLPEALRNAGAAVDELTVYETEPDENGRERLLSLLRRRELDAVTLMSPSAVDSLVRLLDKEVDALLSGVAVACMITPRMV
nr:uroporphyrinogen-III synthase [Geobacillus zalihae]